MNNLPKVYVFAHSMGGMQLTNILLRPSVDAELEESLRRPVPPCTYETVCIVAPYFEQYDSRLTRVAWPYLLSKYKLNKFAAAPEQKLKVQTLAEHKIPWRLDFDNPYHKEVCPIQTLIAMRKEINFHAKNID